MKNQKKSDYNDTNAECLRLWILRILVELNGHQSFVRSHDFNNDRIAIFLGVLDSNSCSVSKRKRRSKANLKQINSDSSNSEDSQKEFNQKEQIAILRSLHQKAEKLGNTRPWGVLVDNVSYLASIIGLNETECRILEFAILINTEPVLDDTADYLENLSVQKAFRMIATIIGLDEKDVRNALVKSSKLVRSGIISISGNNRLRSIFDFAFDNFYQLMLIPGITFADLLKHFVGLCPSPELSLEHYAHAHQDLKLLVPYLKKALANNQKGVNIFIHGAPGTGKTQLARVLSQIVERDLFEISAESEDGAPIDAERRLRVFNSAQSLLANRNALLVFDEAEDIFAGDAIGWKKSVAQSHKAWINKSLEDNQVPTFWLSNSVSCLDNAFVRRFDMIFELSTPPRKSREKMIRELGKNIIPESIVKKIGASEHLAPAVVSRAINVVKVMGDSLPEADVATAFERLISNTLCAQGHQPIPRFSANELPNFYDLSFLNADCNLKILAQGLKTNPRGRLCLYGPPGTGKTAFGRWMSTQIGIPLVVKKASDLLSPYVGGSEQLMSQAFRQAEGESAILLIDEVDSFLQDRRKAMRSWEVSQVNEMLTQMESFSGLFIASTNLMNDLDQAALRRFDVKIHFGFLNPEQAWTLLCKQTEALGIGMPNERLRERLTAIGNLTPGDFSAVARAHAFRPYESPEMLVETLEHDCALKEGNKQNHIGFGSN